MKSRRIGFALLSLLFCLGPLFAEDQPEIAYRILTSYIEKKDVEGTRGAKIAGSIFTGVGSMLFAGGLTTFFAGDAIAAKAGYAFDPQTKIGVSIGLGVGGLVLTGTGIALSTLKPPNFRAEYSDVFSENDRQVREALAVGVLRDLSIKAERSRITGAISSLLVPVLSAAITAGINLSNNRNWYEGVINSASWSAWSLAGGFASLFGSSEEERLYIKYKAAHDALYGEPRPSS